MEKLFRYFSKNHTLATMFTIVIILLGSFALVHINRDINPQVDFGQMLITTVYPGASPQDVEINVTDKLETELKTVSGIKYLTSVSSENLSEIRIVIDDNIKNQNKVKQDIRRAIDQVTELPSEVDGRPKIIELNSSVFSVIEVGIASDTLEYGKLRKLAKNLKSKLEGLPGVSKLDAFSYRAREVKVEVATDKIKNYDISLEQIFSAIQKRNIRASGGNFESYIGQKNIVTLSQFKTPNEVGNVIVKSNFEGITVRVKDLAIVKDGFKKGDIISRMDGKPAISFVIYKKEYADIVETVSSIRNLVEEQKKVYPKNVKFLYSNDVSRLVKNRFEIVTSNGIIGLILVMIVLTFFLNFRTAFWVGLGIPLTILGVIFLLKVTGYSLDAIGLSAIVIVIGIIVDDAIIISENIYRHYDEFGKSPTDAAVDGLKEVFYPVLTTVLTTFLAFGPMFFMNGVMGKFMFVIPLVITFALLVSLIEATLLLPAHIAHGLHRSKNKENDWFEKIKTPFRKFVNMVLKHRYVSMGVFILAFVASVFYFKNYMGFVLIPSSTAERIYIRAELPPGTSLKANSKIIKQVEKVVEEIGPNDLSSYVTRIGVLTGQFGVFRPGKNFSTIEINLTPFGKRVKSANEISKELRAKTSLFKDFTAINYEVAEGGPPVGRDISINIVGNDDKKRKALANDLMAYLGTINGVKDINSDDKFGKDEIHVDLNYKAVAKYGLSVSDIANTVRLAIDGMVATDVRMGGETVDFRVILDEKIRFNEKNIGNLLVSNKFGKVIPLRKVAKFKIRPGIDEFRHHSGERSLTVDATVDQTKATPILVMNEVFKHYNLGRDWHGMRFVIGGEAEESKEAIISLAQTFVISAIGIYFLLILLFNSFLQPFYVLVAIPFGLIGVIIAFAFHGEPLSFLAGLGLIGLAGVVVNDSLVLVDHINQLRKKHPEKPILDIVTEGTTDRLRAIVITTLTTVVGLLPLAYGVGGIDMFMVPMALSMGYGLLFATFLTLLLVPCVYLIGEDLTNLSFRRIKSIDFTKNAVEDI